MTYDTEVTLPSHKLSPLVSPFRSVNLSEYVCGRCHYIAHFLQQVSGEDHGEEDWGLPTNPASRKTLFSNEVPLCLVLDAFHEISMMRECPGGQQLG